MSAIQIQKASIEDAKAIRQIYAPYVLNTAITYETSVPSVEEFQGRIARTLSPPRHRENAIRGTFHPAERSSFC